jgi:hypothetical protein
LGTSMGKLRRATSLARGSGMLTFLIAITLDWNAWTGET